MSLCDKLDSSSDSFSRTESYFSLSGRETIFWNDTSRFEKTLIFDNTANLNIVSPVSKELDDVTIVMENEELEIPVSTHSEVYINYYVSTTKMKQDSECCDVQTPPSDINIEKRGLKIPNIQTDLQESEMEMFRNSGEHDRSICGNSSLDNSLLTDIIKDKNERDNMTLTQYHSDGNDIQDNDDEEHSDRDDIQDTDDEEHSGGNDIQDTDDEALSDGNDIQDTDDEALSDGNDIQDTDDEAHSGRNDIQDTDDEALSDGNDIRDTDDEALSDGGDIQDIDDEEHSGGNDIQDTDDEALSDGNDIQDTDDEALSDGNDIQDTDDEALSDGNDIQDTDDEAHSNRNDIQDTDDEANSFITDNEEFKNSVSTSSGIFFIHNFVGTPKIVHTPNLKCSIEQIHKNYTSVRKRQVKLPNNRKRRLQTYIIKKRHYKFSNVKKNLLKNKLKMVKNGKYDNAVGPDGSLDYKDLLKFKFATDDPRWNSLLSNKFDEATVRKCIQLKMAVSTSSGIFISPLYIEHKDNLKCFSEQMPSNHIRNPAHKCNCTISDSDTLLTPDITMYKNGKHNMTKKYHSNNVQDNDNITTTVSNGYDEANISALTENEEFKRPVSTFSKPFYINNFAASSGEFFSDHVTKRKHKHGSKSSDKQSSSTTIKNVQCMLSNIQKNRQESKLKMVENSGKFAHVMSPIYTYIHEKPTMIKRANKTKFLLKPTVLNPIKESSRRSMGTEDNKKERRRARLFNISEMAEKDDET